MRERERERERDRQTDRHTHRERERERERESIRHVRADFDFSVCFFFLLANTFELFFLPSYPMKIISETRRAR